MPSLITMDPNHTEAPEPGGLPLMHQPNLLYISPMITAPAHDIDRAVVLFHALSDATRLAVLEMLRGGEKCVCELQDELNVAQSKLSFHLRVLKDARLVADRKDGRWSYYTIVPAALDEARVLVVQFLSKPASIGRVLRMAPGAGSSQSAASYRG
ncbi:MAG: hypothetical protein NVS1B4_22500 [Gemmatimonadaceae bacterium]